MVEVIFRGVPIEARVSAISRWVVQLRFEHEIGLVTAFYHVDRRETQPDVVLSKKTMDHLDGLAEMTYQGGTLCCKGVTFVAKGDSNKVDMLSRAQRDAVSQALWVVNEVRKAYEREREPAMMNLTFADTRVRVMLMAPSMRVAVGRKTFTFEALP